VVPPVAAPLVDRVQSAFVGARDSLVDSLPYVLAAGVTLVITGVLARIGAGVVRRAAERMSDSGTVAGILAGTTRLAIWLGGAFVALDFLQLDGTVTSLLAGVGVVGIALGFAMQNVAANFVSGVLLALRQPVRVGDIVKVSDHLGVVERIELRATILRSFGGQLIWLPNKDLLEGHVINYTASGRRRVDVHVVVELQADLDHARASAVAAVAEALGPRAMADPPVAAHALAFRPYGIELLVVAWIDPVTQDYFEVQTAMISAVQRGLAAAAVALPFVAEGLEVTGARRRAPSQDRA
jgi:small conductance mechanosensitive channel